MKIDDGARLSGSALNRANEVRPPSTGQVKRKENEQRADAAGVSDLAAKVLSAGEERVAELKRLYEQDKYTPSAADVAARLIDEHERR